MLPLGSCSKTSKRMWIASGQHGDIFAVQLQCLADHWGNAGHRGEGEGFTAALNPL